MNWKIISTTRVSFYLTKEERGECLWLKTQVLVVVLNWLVKRNI